MIRMVPPAASVSEPPREAGDSFHDEHEREYGGDQDAGDGGDANVERALHHSPHADGQHIAARAREKERDRHVVERRDEGQEGAGRDAGRDHGQRYATKRVEPAGAERTGSNRSRYHCSDRPDGGNLIDRPSVNDVSSTITTGPTRIRKPSPARMPTTTE